MKTYVISYRGSVIKIKVEALTKLDAVIEFLKKYGDYSTDEHAQAVLKTGYLVFHRK